MAKRAERANREAPSEPVAVPPPVQTPEVASDAAPYREDLMYLRVAIREGIEWARANDPSKIAPLSRALRDTWRELDRVDEGESPAKEVDELDDLIDGGADVVQLPSATG